MAGRRGQRRQSGDDAPDYGDCHQDALRHRDERRGRGEVGAAFDTGTAEIAVRFRRPFKIPDAVPLPSNLRYRRAVRRLDELVYRIIKERRRNTGDRGDLLSVLMAARDEDGGAMSDRQLRDEVITLFLAGHETTALPLTWTWYLLSQHPEKEAKLFAELDRALGGRPPSIEDMPQLPYAGAVVHESMRLYPPAYAFGREAVADCEIGGYHPPAAVHEYDIADLLGHSTMRNDTRGTAVTRGYAHAESSRLREAVELLCTSNVVEFRRRERSA